VAALSREHSAANDYIAQINDFAGADGVNIPTVSPRHLCIGLVTPVDASGPVQMSPVCLLTRSQ
jgi:hypothetical protein